MDAIERTLREGQVSWEGLVRNVEYLGLREDVKRYLGRWWKNWRDAEARRARGTGGAAEDEDEEDEEKEASAASYPYPSERDLNMDVDEGEGVGEWTASAVGGGELVDEMAGLLDRF
ncbi:hypothetical protein FRB90_008197 [Tulasnella sp. 427]|nr:hypothetical protein FRB90_008197 [Tulasnella sp. 427]